MESVDSSFIDTSFCRRSSLKSVQHVPLGLERVSNMTKNYRHSLLRTTHPVLSWRLDPEESLSDWTITVVTSSSEKQRKYLNPPRVKKYFVHKAQLGVGPRRSEFFAKIFRSHTQGNEGKGSVKATVDKNIRIELKHSAAVSFPDMLDFIYSTPGKPAHLTTKSAVAIRHLATRFGIRELFDQSSSFIKKDLTIETATVYLIESKELEAQKLETITIKICAKNFINIKMTELVSLPCHCIIHILQSTAFMNCDSERLSLKIASYCRCKEEELTLPLLVCLTDEKIMPNIAAEESIYFIHLLSSLGAIFSEALLVSDEESSSLYKRCFDVAPSFLQTLILRVDDQKMTNREKNKKKLVLSMYKSFPTEVKIYLLEKCIVIDGGILVKDESFEDVVKDKSSEDKYHVSESLVSDVSRARKYALNLEDEMKQMKQAYAIKLDIYKQKLAFKEDEIRRYAKQLQGINFV